MLVVTVIYTWSCKLQFARVSVTGSSRYDTVRAQLSAAVMVTVMDTVAVTVMITVTGGVAVLASSA